MKAFHITPIANAEIERAVADRWDSLTKPQGSLGRLERIVARLALQQGQPRPTLERKSIYVFCGDHGVTAEGVSAFPSEVTRQMVVNFVRGGAAINALCRHNGIHTFVVDAGVKGDPIDGALNRRVREGTRNFAVEPALTRAEVERAIEAGAALAAESHDGIRGVGEMGIGNTTSASALLRGFTGADGALAAGPGTGLAPEAVTHKAAVITRALALHRPDPADPIGVLAAVGGCEIAMMAGFLLGSAERRVPVMMDGFITCAAALAARAINPAVTDYLHYSHRSAEQAHGLMLAALGGDPLFDLGMRLGEGSGAAIAISLVEQALALYDGMATFAEAAVSNRE